MTQADTLRRAADRIDKLTAKATRGPWTVDSHSELEKGCRCLSCWDVPWAYEVREIDGPDSPDGCFYAMHIGQDDAEYIAALGPQVAPHLSLWLRGHADYIEAVQCSAIPDALALARAVLGEPEAA